MSNFTNWLATMTGKEHLWIVESFLVVFATMLCAFVVSKFLSKLSEKANLTKTLWDDALFSAVSRPLKWFIWVMGISYAVTIASRHTESVIFESVGNVRQLAAIFIATWFVTGFIARAEENFVSGEFTQKPMDKTTATAVGKLLRISAIITAVLVALQYLGYSISGVLAFGGIGGIAVGFAAKDLLANFFGGLMIYLDRPFSVGDWVRSPEKNIEGTVEDIGWRLTCIRTFDKRPLYVPNSTFTQISVENPSRMLNRRIYETVGIRYDDAARMAEIVNAVRDMLKNHPELDTSNTLIVNFNAFASSSLDFFIYCFTKTTEWVKYHEVKEDVLLKVLKIIEEHGAECAFPTSTLHIPEKVSLESVTSE